MSALHIVPVARPEPWSRIDCADLCATLRDLRQVRDGLQRVKDRRIGADFRAQQQRLVVILDQVSGVMTDLEAPARHCRQSEAPRLTAREHEVLRWVAKGKSNAVIAEILGISRHTVDTHIRRIFRKLGTADRTSAALRAVADGLLETDLAPARQAASI